MDTKRLKAIGQAVESSLILGGKYRVVHNTAEDQYFVLDTECHASRSIPENPTWKTVGIYQATVNRNGMLAVSNG